MRWTVFAVFCVIALVLDVSLANVLVVRSLGNIAPSFLAVLLVFVVFFAPRPGALWACWIAGMLADACTPLPHGADRVGPILGAQALGFCFAGYLLLQVRAMLYRRSVLTLAAMTALFVLAASVVTAFVYTVHGWYPSEELAWADLRLGGEVLRRFGVAVYTGAVALLVGRVLVWSTPLWSFRSTASRQVAMRR